MRARLVDVLLFSVAVAVLVSVALGGFHVYSRIVAHNALDAAILKVLQQAGPAQK